MNDILKGRRTEFGVATATNREPVRKAAGRPATFSELMRLNKASTFTSQQAANEIGPWLDEALGSMRQVIDAAIAGDPKDATVTPELRLDAVRASCAQFSEQLLERVATAIVDKLPASDVAKRRGRWAGVL